MSNNTFEDFIMQCCKAGEPQLRTWIRNKLPAKYNYDIIEDNYQSERCKKNSAYKSVHNMLLIRGNPRVCLVAHTDVCRDHSDPDGIFYGEGEIPAKMKRVEPVIRKVELEEDDGKVVRNIIQDRTKTFQVGGDDRLGVAINLWIAMHTGHDLALLFTTDEEIGLRSARKVEFEKMKNFDLCVEVDRGNHSRELVTKINQTVLCDYDMATKLLEIAWHIGLPRKQVNGAGTDVAAMMENDVIKQAVNMTCGYHSSHSNNPEEYIDIAEAKDTVKYVSNIVKEFELEKNNIKSWGNVR